MWCGGVRIAQCLRSVSDFDRNRMKCMYGDLNEYLNLMFVLYIFFNHSDIGYFAHFVIKCYQ